MEDVEDDRSDQDQSRDPVIGDPGKSHADLREERGEKQDEHGRGHDPVKQARGERVSLDFFGNRVARA